jgi:hypothetical protein
MSEYTEQVKVFDWAKRNENMHSELRLLNASLNGVKLTIGQAVKTKASGMKAGYPDMFLPVARNGYHGLYIELKEEEGDRVQPDQQWWKQELMAQGYLSLICYGSYETIDIIKNYLDM